MPQMIHGFVDRHISKLVELLDHIAADVHPICFADDVDEARFGYLTPDEFTGERDAMKKTGELTRGTGVTPLAFDDVTFQRDELQEWDCD